MAVHDHAREYAARVAEGPRAGSGAIEEPRDRFALLVVVTGTFGIQGLTLLSGAMAARMLGVEARGQVALIFAMGVLFSLLTFGGSVPVAIAKGLAERRVAARDGLRRVARRWALALLIPCVLAAGLYLPLSSDGGAQNYGFAVAVFAMTLQTIVFRLVVGCLQGEVGHLGRMAAVGIAPQLLYTIALSIAMASGWDWGAREVLLAFLVSASFGVLVGLMALAKPSHRVEDELDEPELRRTARNAFLSSIGLIDGLGVDRILVGAMLGNVQLGLYAAATAVANMCSIVGNAVSVITLPRVAMHNSDPREQRKVVRRWVSLSAGIVALAVVTLELVIAPTIRFAFGDEFAGAIPTARWLIVADGLLGFRRVLVAVLQGQGRGGTASWIEIGVAPVMVVGITVAAFADSLPGIGVTMVVVGGLACLLLGIAVARRPPRHRGVNLEPDLTNSQK